MSWQEWLIYAAVIEAPGVFLLFLLLLTVSVAAIGSIAVVGVYALARGLVRRVR